MSKISPIKFNVEQFQEQSSWIGNLFSTLNAFINDTVVATTNNLTITDNLYQELKEIKFVNNTANFPLKFRTKFNQYPKAFYVGYLFDDTTSSYASLTSAPWVVWSFANQEITISSITGLTTDRTYTIKFHVIYG